MQDVKLLFNNKLFKQKKEEKINFPLLTDI